MRLGISCLVIYCLVLAFGAKARTDGQKGTTDQKNSMIAKVIEMLGEEKDKIQADLDHESKVMAEYMEWCDDTQTEHAYAIKFATSKIEDLSALIEDNSAQIKGLDEEIADLGTEIAERNTEMEEAIANREKEKEEFAKAEAEQLAMVEELEAMEVALKKQMAAMTTPPPVPEEGAEGAEPAAEGEAAPVAELQTNKSPAGTFEALVQLHHHGSNSHRGKAKAKGPDMVTLERAMQKMINSVWVDPESKRNLALLKKDGSFIQSGEEPEATAAPTVEIGADALAGQQENNANNLAAFEGLKGKAEEALQRQREEEVKKQHEHDMQMMSLKEAIHLAEDKVDDAKRDHARLSEEKAKAEEELAEVEAGKAGDEKALASVTQQCDEGATAWATRQSEAKAEMAAIEKAKQILAERVTVFIQIKAQDPADTVKAEVKLQKLRQKLVVHFRKLGSNLHSLAMLNLVSVASTEPMAQVKNLLSELIAKLQKEAAEAANLHAFCQEEKKKTTEAKEKKQMTLDKLDSRIDKATTKKTELEENIADLSNEIAELDKSDAEATKIRNEEHEVFLKTEADFSGAAEAVDDAIDALKSYYGETFLIQRGQVEVKSKTVQPTLGGAKSDSAGGIISILETMGEEFRKTVKEARSEERADQKQYDTMMNEHKVAKASKEAEIKGSQSEVKSLTTSVHQFGGDYKMATKEMGAIMEYVEKLKPQCHSRTVPYAEAKAKREAEISGLKEALSILEEESPAGAFSFLQKRWAE